jgi:hypothetical protein
MMACAVQQKKEIEKYGKIISPGARGVEAAHRRWGKDDVAMHFTACAAHMRTGNYWHMLPQFSQCRIAIWDAINPRTGIRRIDEAFPPSIRLATNSTQMKITFKCGSMWQLIGSDNFNSIVGSPPIGICCSEWALANPLAWFYLSPILDENGGWAMFISTTRGRNHFKTFYDFAVSDPAWFADMKKASETKVFTKEQQEKTKREYIGLHGKEMGEALYLQEFECSFEGAVMGSYYSKQMADARKEGRICKVPWIPEVEVNTYWDLGLDDSMTIWFIQHIGLQHRVINYIEGTGLGLLYFARKMKELPTKEFPYIYGNHYMPHDANVHEMTNNEIALTRKESAEALGIKPIEVIPRAQNMDVIVNVHIPAVRKIIASCWFDEENCRYGINGLENYHAKWDDVKKVLTKRPDHDHNSHPADGFRTFACGFEEIGPKDKSVSSMMGSKKGNILLGQ